MRIQTKAVALCRDAQGRVLVERGHDGHGGGDFLRAIGGSVEFGERAADAVAREWREEFGLGLEELRLLGVLENLFTYEGRAGHEIVFVFAARVAEPGAYERGEFESVEPGGQRHTAVWVSPGNLAAGGVPLYPQGVLDLLPPSG